MDAVWGGQGAADSCSNACLTSLLTGLTGELEVTVCVSKLCSKFAGADNQMHKRLECIVA